jgi:hypothetical protein
MNPDQLAELEDERRFLLSRWSISNVNTRSAMSMTSTTPRIEGRLHGACRRYIAGDRARSLVAAPSRPQLASPDRCRRRRGRSDRRGVVGAFGIVGGTHLSQQMSGLDRDRQQQLMSQARQLQFESPGAAAELYAEVLELEPDNVEVTYRGWTLALDAVQRGAADSAESAADETVVTQMRDAVDALAAAIELDPTYPDPQCFLGIVTFRFLGQAEQAAVWVDGCLAGGPPADVRDLVESMQAEIAAS